MPGVPLRQPVGLLRAPRPSGTRMDGRDVAEYRVHDLPGRLDRVLPGEQPPLPVKGRADQLVVGAHIAAGPLGEGQVVHLGLRRPPAGEAALLMALSSLGSLTAMVLTHGSQGIAPIWVLPTAGAVLPAIFTKDGDARARPAGDGGPRQARDDLSRSRGRLPPKRRTCPSRGCWP